MPWSDNWMLAIRWLTDMEGALVSKKSRDNNGMDEIIKYIIKKTNFKMLFVILRNI